jgi:uncharacterized membrane protein YdfJ with MMPL/SSD domain
MSNSSPHSLISRAVTRAARASSRRPRVTIALWLVLIVACVAGGTLAGTRTLGVAASGTGESAAAYNRLSNAGLLPPAVENVLVRSATPALTARTVAAAEPALGRLPGVRSIRGPGDTPELTRDHGRVALLAVQLRGDPTTAGDRVAPVQGAVAAVARAHPAAQIRESGSASVDRAINAIVNQDLGRAELFSLPITLAVLVLVFGALVAASVPLLLGVTSVAATLGALGLVSQIAPNGQSTAPVVVLVGLAVGVDYSLFYIRRELEERRAGRGPDAALAAAAGSVGRAIAIAGVTVMVSLAGLLITRLGVFVSMALGAILVVAIAVVGSITVLPAVLARLGDRIERGRVLPRAITSRGYSRRAWARVAGAVTGHPWHALISALCVLGALALPVLTIHTADPGENDLPPRTPAIVAQRAIERWFPGSPATADIVVVGRRLDAPGAAARLSALGRRALAVTHGSGPVPLQVAADGRTAVLSVPMRDRGFDAAASTIAALRARVDPTAARVAPGATAQVTGDAAFNVDFSARMSTVTPLVIGAVLALAFALLLAAFRSPKLAAAVVGLNLLSVGAAFGVLVAIFQHHWAQSLLGFTSDGAIVPWLPVFAFVLLFGLSMDYTVLMLERVREARLAGADARAAAAEAVTATAGTVTSAAVVMVAVFSIFATLRLLEFKQLGVGLAAAIALDATIVRAIALPAVVTLLGRGRTSAPERAERGREGWDHARERMIAIGSSVD